MWRCAPQTYFNIVWQGLRALVLIVTIVTFIGSCLSLVLLVTTNRLGLVTTREYSETVTLF